jgi:hypothetical protein
VKVKLYTESIDYLSTNLLVLPFFSGVKPLKGTIGFVDWRLNSFLSRLIINNRIEGKFFEKILIPPFERIPAERILLNSLGKYEEIDPVKIAEYSQKLLETCYKISYANFALAVPIELEKHNLTKELIDGFFKGVDRFAIKIGICEFLENLRITFVIDKFKQPKTFETYSNYLSSRSISPQALVNA